MEKDPPFEKNILPARANSPSFRSGRIDPRLRRRGILLMVGAGLCWSTGGILIRHVSLADSWEIVLWRSVFMVIFLFAVLALWHRRKVLYKIAGVGFQGALCGFFLALTFFFFILSVTRNTVANTLVLMSTGPLFVAFFGRIFLTESVPPRTWAAMGVALAGITLMFSEGLDRGQSLGNLLALGVPTAFSLNIIILRRARAHVDMVPSVMLAGVFSILIALPLAWPLTPNLPDLTILGIMGSVQLGTGCVLMTIATRYLTAGEVGLLALLETILGPIWVWLGIGERPADMALLGGMIVVGALAFNEWLGFREARSS
jgi:drug/metabolite transporter (DMT)-like permease